MKVVLIINQYYNILLCLKNDRRPTTNKKFENWKKDDKLCTMIGVTRYNNNKLIRNIHAHYEQF